MAKAVTTVRRLLPVLFSLRPDPRRAAIVAAGGSAINIGGAIEDMQMRLTMDRASTLTVSVADPAGELWRDEAMQGDVRLTFPAPRYVDEWRLWQSRDIGSVTRQGDLTVLTFWDAGSAALKRVVSPLTRSASSLSWAGWVALNASQAARDYRLTPVVPRPNSTPPREEAGESTTTAGWSVETRKQVKVNGAPADHDQLRNMDISFAAAVKEKAPARATLAMGCAGTKESGWKAVMNTAGSPYGGVFQGNVRDGTWDINDTDGMATSFLRGGKGFQGGGAIKLARENPSYSVGRIAVTVEGSAANFGSLEAGARFYDGASREARSNLELWAGVTLDRWSTVTGPAGESDGYGDTGNERPTDWRRGRPGENESALKALSRDGAGLGQRVFVAGNRLVAWRDQDGILAAPHLTVDLIDDPILDALPSFEPGSNTLNIQVDVDQWGAPPGAVVEFTSNGSAPRTWLVQSVDSSSDSDTADIVLQQPTTKIPKPPTTREQAGAQLTGTAQEVAVKWAISKLDVREKPSGSNNGPEVARIITDNGGSPGQPWCGYFCRGALRAAGLTPATGMASVQWIYDTAGSGGDVFRGRTAAHAARPGDLAILYGTGTHVGLVEKVASGKVHTIEGNTSRATGGQGVSRKVHAFSDIVAIAQVKWPGDSVPDSATTDSGTPYLRRPFPGDG